MKWIQSIAEIKQALYPFKYKEKIALIPTMGNLHEGHLALIRKAKQAADITVVSIFVNPLQFAPHEDFSRYPRTIAADKEKLAPLNVNFIFAPPLSEMYPDQAHQTKVNVPHLSDQYCGRFRPSFFYGVTTVVAKLFNIIQPDIAIFGEKDFQQFRIINKMVTDLAFPIELLSVPTVREQDGLALSSRNQYLSSQERTLACLIYQTLIAMKDKLSTGQESHDKIIQEGIATLESKNFKVDYLTICQRDTLAVASPFDKELIILIAAWLGYTRLIDNLMINL
jgi:pantoate--beta-alanine ligase